MTIPPEQPGEFKAEPRDYTPAEQQAADELTGLQQQFGLEVSQGFVLGLLHSECDPEFWSRVLSRWSLLPGDAGEHLTALRQIAEQATAEWQEREEGLERQAPTPIRGNGKTPGDRDV